MVELVRRRGGAATRHHLDLVGAASERLPRRAPNFVGAVGQDGFAGQAVYRAEKLASCPRPLVIAVATGLREKGPADEESRSADQSQADGFLEPPIETAGVAHRRETRLQRIFDLARDSERDHGRREGHFLNRIEVETGQVDMGVEQTGHQGAPLAIDDRGIARTSRPARGADPPDPHVVDDHS